jgi:tRNA(Ile)-lysidine synthase
MHPPPELVDAVAAVPAGAWAVGVSGGADSVALLNLLRLRADVSAHVVHLDHETRGPASTGDADFVADLAARWGLPCTVARWRDVAPEVPARLTNPSARFRAGRRVLFRRVVAAHSLGGVVLAHHADDQAETVLLRLLRGSGPAGLGGMAPRAVLGGLVVLRPLLALRGEALREWLRDEGQPWREDESNASGKYLRNRVRRVLASRPDLTGPLIELADAARALAEWVRAFSPREESPVLDVAALRDLPGLLARETAKRWLAGRGAPPEDLTGEVLDRLVTMAADAASTARQHFPGGVLVRRRGGRLSVADET